MLKWRYNCRKLVNTAAANFPFIEGAPPGLIFLTPTSFYIHSPQLWFDFPLSLKNLRIKVCLNRMGVEFRILWRDNILIWINRYIDMKRGFIIGIGSCAYGD